MKRLVALLALLASPVAGQQSGTPAAPEIAFDSKLDFLQPRRNLGEVLGIAVSPKGRVVVLNHPGSSTSGPLYGNATTQLLEYDESGRFVRELGQGVYGLGYAHSVRFDKAGNLWVVDKGTNSVMRFDPEGFVTMNFGRRPEGVEEHEFVHFDRGATPPRHRDGYFNQPTDIAWDAAGNSYITDGYVNSRVAKIDKNGDWVKSWGTRGAENGQFNTPHNIGVDRAGNVYVADRGNARIQVFDGDGRFLRVIKIAVPVPAGARQVLGDTSPEPPTTGTLAAGAPWTICLTEGPTQYLYTSDAFPGRIYKLSLDGRVVGMLGRAGRQPGQFNWIHGIACPSENELFVADMNNWRVQKLTLHPDRTRSSVSGQ
jgi:hypothetical protein